MAESSGVDTGTDVSDTDTSGTNVSDTDASDTNASGPGTIRLADLANTTAVQQETNGLTGQQPDMLDEQPDMPDKQMVPSDKIVPVNTGKSGHESPDHDMSRSIVNASGSLSRGNSGSGSGQVLTTEMESPDENSGLTDVSKTPKQASGDETGMSGDETGISDGIIEPVVAKATGEPAVGNTVIENPVIEKPVDPIAALKAQISGDSSAAQESGSTAAKSPSAGLFVEKAHADRIEADVAEISLQLDDLVVAVTRMNSTITQALERNAVISARVESNEGSLRNMATIHEGFERLDVDMDHMKVVIQDISRRMWDMETSNPVSQNDVRKALDEINGRISTLSSSMSALSKMITRGGINDGQVLSLGSVDSGVSRHNPPAVDNTVFANANDDSNGDLEITTVLVNAIPDDVCRGDYIDGYGEVKDVTAAHDNQKLVSFRDNSVLLPGLPVSCDDR